MINAREKRVNLIIQYSLYVHLDLRNYKKKIADNIVKLCDISKNQINIKGKTTEKLGVIGKEKAIACEVIISVIKYD